MEKHKILCVDDNPDNLIAIKAILGDMGAEIITAQNGEDALLLIEKHGFALALLDIQMHGMNGYELAARIKKTEKSAGLPIIFLSAVYSDHNNKLKGYETGAVDFITKPFEPQFLQSKVRVFLQLEQMKRELESKIEIEKSKNYFESILESTKEAIVVIGFDSKVMHANRSSLLLWDYPIDEIKGIKASLLLESDAYQDWLAALSGYKAGEDSSPLFVRDIEVLVFTKYGYKNPAIINCSPLIDANKNIKGGVLSVIDITERKYIEKAFWENEEKLKYVTNFAKDAIIMMTPKGKISFWNRAATHIFGYTDEEVYGIDLHTLLAPKQYHAAFKSGFAQFIKTGDGAAINETLELTALRKSGEEFPIELSLSSILINKKWNAIGIARDISERKLAEQKIIESELYYRTLIETSPDAIITSDAEGIITYVSEKAVELFGITEISSIVGTSILLWVEPEHHNTVLERFAGIIESTYKPSKNHYRLLKADKTPFDCEITSSPIKDSHQNVTGLLIIAHDITDRIIAERALIAAKEKAEESDRLKAAFIQNISHEIRTPMNAMVGFSELLMEPGQSDKEKKIYMENIIKGTNQLLSIITDIVEISNIKSNLLKVNPVEVNPVDILTAVHSKLLFKAEEKKLDFNIINKLGGGDEPILLTDRLLLYKTMEQLVSNAIKFTQKGSVTIGCNMAGAKINFFIRDTGIGIPKEYQDRIFESFYQVEDSVARRYEGTGLGLTITRAYVELLGGKILVNSEPESGTEISFSLPCRKREKKEKTSRRGSDKGSSLNILVAEDDNNNFNLITSYLKDTRFNIIRANNGLEAVNGCKSDIHIDLVLMDLRMPIMDGLEASKEIKLIRPYLPIVAQTAYVDDKQKVFDCGCSGYISKPYSRSQLLTVINSIITEQRKAGSVKVK